MNVVFVEMLEVADRSGVEIVGVLNKSLSPEESPINVVNNILHQISNSEQNFNGSARIFTNRYGGLVVSNHQNRNYFVLCLMYDEPAKMEVGGLVVEDQHLLYRASLENAFRAIYAERAYYGIENARNVLKVKTILPLMLVISALQKGEVITYPHSMPWLLPEPEPVFY